MLASEISKSIIAAVVFERIQKNGKSNTHFYLEQTVRLSFRYRLRQFVGRLTWKTNFQKVQKKEAEAAQEEESSCLVNWFGLLTISLLAPKSATGANFRSDIVYL